MRHALNPKIFGLRPSMVLYLYRRRLRSHAVQELLAGGGVAVGVALLVGVLASSATLTRAGDELIRGLVGHARVALAAPSMEAGFSEATANAAGRVPGARVAVYLLREDVSVAGPHGRVPIQLIGVTSNLADLGGLEVAESGAEVGVLAGGLALPAQEAQRIGAQVGESVKVLAGGEAHYVRVRALLNGGHVQGLSNSPVAVALLPVAQALTGRAGTVSAVMIEPAPGQARLVESGLRRLAGGALKVGPIPQEELQLLTQATGPSHQSTTLFAAVGAMVGFLLALNALLLTAPERRRFVADLQTDGYDWRQILMVVGFQVLALGLIASAVGVVAGELLARTLFHQNTAGLSIGFPLGTMQAVDPRLVALALGSGVVATVLASIPVLFELLPGAQARAAERRLDAEVITPRLELALAGFAVAVIGVVTVVLLMAPGLTIAGLVVLGAAVPSLTPLLFTAALRVLDWCSERVPSSALIVAVRELRGASVRSVVVGSVAALAVYSTVAISGGRMDLFSGSDQAIKEQFATAGVWVAPKDSIIDISSFAAGDTPARIAALPGVSSVRSYQASLLDAGKARVLVIARPASDPTMVLPGQLVKGDLGRTNELLRGSGWMAVSAGFANEHQLRIGDAFPLVTPGGTASLRVAAIVTNIDWPPGLITMSATDYRHLWRTSDPSALEVNFKAGVGPVAGKHEVESVLGNRPGLSANTAAERAARSDTTLREQLESLTVISTLLLIAAAVAVALVLSAAIWQRRSRLASLRIQGYDPHQLWRALVVESATVLAVGWAVGIILGEYGHRFVSRWLKITTGFPVQVSIGGVEVLVVFALVVGVALAVVALPGAAAARVSPRLSFQE